MQAHKRKLKASRSRSALVHSDVLDLTVSREAPASMTSTPKRGLGPKVSSYFTHATSNPARAPGSLPSVVSLPILPRALAPWQHHDETLLATNSVGKVRRVTAYKPPVALAACQPVAEQLMDSILQAILCEPDQALERHHTSSILQVLEAYRALREESFDLQERVEVEMNRRSASEAAAERARQIWQTEKRRFEDEVKRLEVLVENGQQRYTSVAEVQPDSEVTRDLRRASRREEEDGKETIFEFLDRSRVEEDAARQTQRGKSGGMF